MISIRLQISPQKYCLLLCLLWTFCVLFIEVCASSDAQIGCSLPSEDITGYLNHPGDFVIGGTFMIHLDRVYNNLDFTSKPPIIECQMFATEYYETMSALIFAVEEINSDPELLPNVTLGYQVFDTCNNLRLAAQATLSLLSGGNKIVPNYHFRNGEPLAGIIGESGSTRSIIMAQILGLYHYPQISYFASSPLLSDRALFPSFLRTIPNDEFQMRGLAQLVFYYGWTWVGLLVNDNDYGQFGLFMIKQEVLIGGACLAFTENIITSQPNRNAPYLVQVIKKSTAKVVVVITSDSDFVIVTKELIQQNVTGRIWIASEAWSSSNLLLMEQFQGILVGTIGFAIRHGQVPMFSSYLNILYASKNLNDSFLREFHEQTFSCKFLRKENPVNWMDNSTMKVCTGNEQVENIPDEKEQRLSLNVYTAVYALATGLHNLLHCTPGAGPFHHGDCANISSFQPWHLLRYVKNVSFKIKDGSHISFDEKGNPLAIYDIVNWHQNANGRLVHSVIGKYDLNPPDGKQFTLDTANITWSGSNTQVPLSKCNLNCPPGFQKVIIPGNSLCCYGCVRCPQGHISNQTDAVECHPCAKDAWPNLQQDRCLPRPTEFLSYQEPLGYCFVTITIFSSLVPLFILAIFIQHKQTPIVRANNYSLSCLLLISLFLCFLCALGFIGYPQTEKCLLRQVAFGMVFALCISCVLAKTITVIIAFNAIKPGSRLFKLTGVKVSYSLIVLCVSGQLFLCMMWLMLYPPFSESDTDTKPGFIIVNCNEGSPSAFWCMLGYLGFMATISFTVAFFARSLPDSFNEAKFITFSMLAFLSVWVSFMPAYLSAQGMYTNAMEVFAILCSSWALIICIFIPKCFIILFLPKMNSREHLMARMQRYVLH